MINSQIEEPLVVQSYYGEYLEKIFKYQNCLRKSIFIRYLNINKTASTHHDITDATFDKFKSGIYFDTYDYTPAYLVNQITNTSTDRNDLTGYKFDSDLAIVTYSILEPNINDIVLFPYKPHASENIFRVKNISTTIKNRIYQLDLEYAPIRDLTTLNYLNNYVYLATKEKNIELDKYLALTELYDKIKLDFEILQLKFNKTYELYYYEFNNYQLAPLIINKQLNEFISTEINNNRYFDLFLKPFGIYNFITNDNIAINITDPKNGYVYLNNSYYPKLLSDFSFTKDPNVYDNSIDYSQFNIDNLLFDLILKLGGLYEI